MMLVLSVHPLTDGYRGRLERDAGVRLEYTTLAKIRVDGLRSTLISRWRDHRRPVVIAHEAPSAAMASPAIALLALALKWPVLHEAGPDGALRPLSKFKVAIRAMRLVVASLEGWLARRSVMRQLRSTLRRIESTPTVPGIATWEGQRVLYLKNAIWFGLHAGGSVGHVAGVVNGLIRAGARVEMVTTDQAAMIDARVPQHHPPAIGVLALPSAINLFRLHRRSVAKALAVARVFRPTCIYQRLTLGDWVGAEVAERLQIPLIVEYNGSEIWVSRHWGAGRPRFADDFERAEDMMLRRANFVFTISKVLAEELEGRGVHPERSGWYPNGIDPTIFDPDKFSVADIAATRRETGLPEDALVITFIGTFGDWHGADIFASACIRLSADAAWMRAHRVRFLFIGDGKNRVACERRIMESSAAEFGRFVGLVPQARAPTFLAASDIFVSPHVPNADGSRFFGSPTKLYEYMAMQRPIVASRLEQISEALEDGRTALLVKPGDVEELAGALRRLVQDRELGRRLAAAARETALRDYTWDRHVQAMTEAMAVRLCPDEGRFEAAGHRRDSGPTAMRLPACPP